ncbi:DUF6879 family protein [Actinomadura livida]|uniref:DUF6879 domain-containing protein n=1 Tax=Actinomadura livida TaxID=79909 RepID=A0A7W7I7E1_9ACTN|nr:MULTISPECIES: DUF6879 family protein [Actinomadura]MBB4771897.1 hypothetical protein [Actinomadura catellatispora]GGU03222.1 hypothetical protein GCM10010208_29200 [Actinomadura livida]
MAELLTGDQLGELFHTVRRCAFRLETRDRYNVPNEHPSFEAFLGGHRELDESVSSGPWYDMTRQAAEQGRPFSRVRVVTVPLGDYSRYALWSAQGNLAAGEEIRYLDRDRAARLDLPVRPPVDSWLFDDERVAVLHFDADDAFIGAELIDEPETVEQHQAWRRIAWDASLSRDEFMRSL